MRTGWLPLAVLVSFSALARVDIQEKEGRVAFIEKIAEVAPSVSVEVYQRELEYERQGLPMEIRARHEANLLAEQIRSQVLRAYEILLEQYNDHQKAVNEVKVAVEKDLALAAPEFRRELRTLALMTLDDLQRGIQSQEVNLEKVEEVLLESVQERARYLNQGEYAALGNSGDNAAFIPSPNSTKDAEKLNYANKKEIVETLVADRDNTRWVSTANMNMKTGDVISTDATISLQVNIEFLGVAVNAGPTIKFKREYQTNATILAEGLSPILMSNGNFDVYKRDRNGNLLLVNNKPQRRYLAFFCDTSMKFSTDYTGSGGFKVAGVGGSTSASRSYDNSVTLTSRRILVPDYVDNKSVTASFLSDLCHRDFLNAKVNARLTVKDSLNVMMRNHVSSLRFSHPQTKCATDNHCINWYNKEVIGLMRIGNYPRCAEESREKYFSCTLRGLKGQNCAVYKNGKRVSNGMFEFICDKGLKCVQTKEEGWFKNWDIYQHAEGKCMPINAKTYRSPLERPKDATPGYIEVQVEIR
jgi:hypothetical protein